MRGLSPTDEYMRLDYLTGKLLAHDTGRIAGETVAVDAEVIDFLEAFGRLPGPQLLTVN